MTTVVSPALKAARARVKTLAEGAFTSAGLSGPVAKKIRPRQASPYAKIGLFTEVIDPGDFSDADGYATRVSTVVAFWSRLGQQTDDLASAYVEALTAGPPALTGFNTYLFHQPTLIEVEEEETDGSTLYGVIVEAVLVVEPT